MSELNEGDAAMTNPDEFIKEKLAEIQDSFDMSLRLEEIFAKTDEAGNASQNASVSAVKKKVEKKVKKEDSDHDAQAEPSPKRQRTESSNPEAGEDLKPGIEDDMKPEIEEEVKPEVKPEVKEDTNAKADLKKASTSATRTYPRKHLTDVLVSELQSFISMATWPPEYDRVDEHRPNRVGHRFRIITKDRVAFFVNFNVLRHFDHTNHGAAWRSYDPPLNLGQKPFDYSHGTAANVGLILDFVAGDDRLDAPRGGWPAGWLKDRDDKAILGALLLAGEMKLVGLVQTFQHALGILEEAKLVDYKRVFRLAARGKNLALAAYFAACIVDDVWKEKGSISITNAFTIKEVAGIPADYLWAFAHPLMVDEAGKRGGDHHPMPRDSKENDDAVQNHFKKIFLDYRAATKEFEEQD